MAHELNEILKQFEQRDSELVATVERVGNLIGDLQRKIERLAARVEALEGIEFEEVEGQIGFVELDEEADTINYLGWAGAQP